MSGVALQKLMFSVNLLDQVTGPAGKIRKTLGGVADTAKSAFAQIGIGAAGIAGAGYAMHSLLSPAIEMDRALGEVKSMGVASEALQELSETALQFSVDYGKSASDFVRSSYDIQSAIGGLTSSELSSFTKAGNLLAAATKADSKVITDYMGTMYSVFQDTARKMGRANWVEQLTGQTAMAVQMFKTDGQKMSEAFKALGADASNAGRSLAEQMAVMGTLQATMSGSESATKYRSFLSNVGKAQQALGLEFTDSNGRMLGMIEILKAIKGKYGDIIDVAEGDELKKAFGTQEAVSLIQLLLGKTGQLESSIASLGSVTGMDKASEMAAAMVDPWQKLGAGMTAVSIAIGQALLPVINPLVDSLSDGSKALLEFTREYKNITRWLGIGIVTILGVSAALAALTVTVGISRLVWQGMVIVGKAYLLFEKMIPMLGALRAAMIKTNVAMMANPVGLIVGGIALLVAAVGSAIYWWDDLRSALRDTSWGMPIMYMVDSIGAVFSAFGRVVMGLFDIVATAAKPLLWILEKVASAFGVEQLFSFKTLGDIAGAAFTVISLAIGGVASMFELVLDVINAVIGGIAWVQNVGIGLLNKIPGVDIETNAVGNDIATPTLDAPKTANLPAGGINKQITNAVNNSANSNKTVNVGQIVTQQPAASIEQELLMAGA